MRDTMVFLDKSIIDNFKRTIDSSPIFREMENYKKLYNLICVFIERIYSAVEYLNSHSALPETEEQLIAFIVYATILRDGVHKLYEKAFEKKPPFYDEKKYFIAASNYSGKVFNSDTCPTDDNFFEYFRAMAFAHPFEVSARRGRPFMKAAENHCCPFLIVEDALFLNERVQGMVGFRVYSNFTSEMDDCFIPFEELKKFLSSRYDSINELTSWAEKGIFDQNKKWKEVKVNREQEPIELMKEIVRLLESRFMEHYIIDNAIEYLACPLSDSRNTDSVSAFRNEIIESLPAVCDCIDSLDYDGMYDALSVVNIIPKRMHHNAFYQLEKIFAYLDERNDWIDPVSDESWGLKQARNFSNEFAKKWVIIDVDSLPYTEIRLLVQTACFLEAKEQMQICGND